jgi:hypothetical protein
LFDSRDKFAKTFAINIQKTDFLLFETNLFKKRKKLPKSREPPQKALHQKKELNQFNNHYYLKINIF